MAKEGDSEKKSWMPSQPSLRSGAKIRRASGHSVIGLFSAVSRGGVHPIALRNPVALAEFLV
jgi:hypothetical protein